jgi:hypothetical protein
MMHLRRATLLVAFSLLTSATTASAECAWVLWMQVALSNHLPPPGTKKNASWRGGPGAAYLSSRAWRNDRITENLDYLEKSSA